jgi:hypothetical protein
MMPRLEVFRCTQRTVADKGELFDIILLLITCLNVPSRGNSVDLRCQNNLRYHFPLRCQPLHALLLLTHQHRQRALGHILTV